MIEPALPHIGDRNRFKAEGRRRADLQLRIDLGGQLPRGIAVWADARLIPFAVFVVAEAPDTAAEVRADTADSERVGCV